VSPTRARNRRASVARETPTEAASDAVVQSGPVYLPDPLELEQMLTG